MTLSIRMHSLWTNNQQAQHMSSPYMDIVGFSISVPFSSGGGCGTNGYDVRKEGFTRYDMASITRLKILVVQLFDIRSRILVSPTSYNDCIVL